ncbi:hypothetical protein PybrP1_010620 [[Pythium] brassicae (nom. inval.)]|nr:hypothetical protein PybrP1_010620 [[Pythium] brassicae (nom. inval.)]
MIYSPVSKISTAAVSSISETEVLSTSAKERAALPKILGVGRVPGKVEDMIYGMLSPTPTHSQIKSAYLNDEIADCRILHEIKGATPDEPLQFLGLKWIIKAHSAVIGTMVRQRDFVFVESVGMKTRADGSRFGYFVMHSVEVPECSELTQFQIVRGRLSLVYIITQSTSGMMDVFMKSYVEVNGTLPDIVGVRTASNSLVAVALAEVGGHYRKLGWAVTKQLRSPTRQTAGEASCSNCNKSIARFSTALPCFFCLGRVCSKCCEQRDFTIPNPDAKRSSSANLVTKMRVVTCTRCYSTVFRNQSAEDVAREEVLAGEYGSISATYQAKTKRSSSASSSTKSLNAADMQNLVISPHQSTNSAKGRYPTEWSYGQQQTQHVRNASGSVVELDRSDFIRLPGTGYHGQGYNGAAPLPPHMAYADQQQPRSNGVPPPQPSSDEDLYTRIAKLNQTVEQVYQYTKRTANTSSGSNGVTMARS